MGHGSRHGHARHEIGEGPGDSVATQGKGRRHAFIPKEENESLAETAQVTATKRHAHAGGLDFASPCGLFCIGIIEIRYQRTISRNAPFSIFEDKPNVTRSSTRLKEDILCKVKT